MSVRQALFVAKRVAKKYKRRVWWMDEQDLRQEATAVALHAITRFDPEPATSLSAYLTTACSRALRELCLRQSAPVSTSRNRLNELRGVHHLDPIDYQDEMPTAVDSGALYEDAQWNETVRNQVFFLCSSLRHGQVVARMLLDDEQPAQVATRTGIPIKELYNDAKRAKREIGDNALMHYMMANR